MLSLKRKLSPLLVSPQLTDTVPPLLLSAQTHWLPRSYPSSNRDSDTTVGSRGELGGPSTSRLEQSHKNERRHTLTQNLMTIGLWVLSLIRCSTFTFLSDVEHNSHLHTTILGLYFFRKCKRYYNHRWRMHKGGQGWPWFPPFFSIFFILSYY